MTLIHFAFNAPEQLLFACKLARKKYMQGEQLIVYSSDENRLKAFDNQLWEFAPLEFIPHVWFNDTLAQNTPIVLCHQDHDMAHHQGLLNLDTEWPPFFSRFENLFEVVSTDPQDKEAARLRFRFYKDRGYIIKNHDLSAQNK